jgi:hypothetical protein
MAAIPVTQQLGRTVFRGALAGALAFAALPAPAADIAKGAETLCAHNIAEREPAQGIPRHLLSAISLTESGRWDPRRRAIIAWPWTVHANGRGLFFESKEAAIAAVERLRTQGVENIDVGCMQINLYFHPNAFEDLDAAFDPARNVAYGARFLRRLRDEKRSWSRAVANYHSATREHNLPYQKKVFRLWRQVRRLATQARRQALIDAYRERRAARRSQQTGREPDEHRS